MFWKTTFTASSYNCSPMDDDPLLERIWVSEKGPLRRLQIYLYRTSTGWYVEPRFEELRPEYVLFKALTQEMTDEEFQEMFPRAYELRDDAQSPHLIRDEDLEQFQDLSRWGPKWNREETRVSTSKRRIARDAD